VISRASGSPRDGRVRTASREGADRTDGTLKNLRTPKAEGHCTGAQTCTGCVAWKSRVSWSRAHSRPRSLPHCPPLYRHPARPVPREAKCDWFAIWRNGGARKDRGSLQAGAVWSSATGSRPLVAGTRIAAHGPLSVPVAVNSFRAFAPFVSWPRNVTRASPPAALGA